MRLTLVGKLFVQALHKKFFTFLGIFSFQIPNQNTMFAAEFELDASPLDESSHNSLYPDFIE